MRRYVFLRSFLEIAVFVEFNRQRRHLHFAEIAFQCFRLERMEMLLHHEREQEDHQKAEEKCIYDVWLFHFNLVIVL